MKHCIMLAIAFAPAVLLFGQVTDFRGATWGSSLTSIKASEKTNFVMKIKDDELVYKDLLDGEDCTVYYIFNDNAKLESGVYRFTKNYSNPQLYVEDYDKFRALLIEKYGIPANETASWNNDAGNTEKSNYGQAVADGRLSLNTVWRTNRSIVKIVLITTAAKRPALQINYTTRSLDQLENQAELRAALGKL